MGSQNGLWQEDRYLEIAPNKTLKEIQFQYASKCAKKKKNIAEIVHWLITKYEQGNFRLLITLETS